MKSMTGFSSIEFTVSNNTYRLNIKSLNSRYLDIHINLPSELSHIEQKIIKKLQKYFSRGKIELTLSIIKRKDEPEVILNKNVLKTYINIIQNEYNQKEMNFIDVLRLPGVITLRYEPKELKYSQQFEKHIEQALKEVLKMRKEEGKNTLKDIKKILESIEKWLNDIKKRAPAIIKEYEDKLKQKIKRLIDTERYDENRVLMEVAFLADKIDINEEIKRLDSHIKQIKKLLKKDTPVGKQIDFLLQEMWRELNTINAKVSDVKVTGIVVQMKNSVEKLREHIRNIE